MARPEERSRTRSYDEVTRYQVTSSAQPISRTRSRSGDDRNQDSNSRVTETLVRTQSRSQTRPSYYYPDCIPCSSVRPSSTIRKRLIVCCDGTFCAADKGKENNPTNIARLSRVIANTGIDDQGVPIVQIVNYQSGVGTGKLTALNRATQGAFGYGLNEKVCEAYTFLVNNYGPGDEIFIFGFSRGAYTARTLASIIVNIGLMSPGMMDYWDEVFLSYKNRDRRTEADFASMRWSQEFVTPGELGLPLHSRERITRYDYVRQWAHLHVKVRVVGVYDTVGSVGMSGWVPQPGEDIDWHATKLSPKIQYAFHALALDEHRGNFPPTMFYLDRACREAGVKLHQCWFPGYHSCVGGESDPSVDVNSVDEITFAWMIDQLTRYNLLQVNRRALGYPLLDRLSMKIEPNGNRPSPPRNVQEAHERRIDWSDGQLVETQTLFMHITSEIATRRWDYTRQPGEYRARDPVTKEDLGYSAFKETIHPSVWHRIQNRTYEPRALPASRWKRQRVPDGKGFEWVMAGRSGLIQVRIPEYKIPDIEERETGMEHWTGCLEQRLAPGDYLRELDRVNGVVRGGQRPSSVRVDSGRRSEYGEKYLSPVSPRDEPNAYDGSYFGRETVVVRSRGPSPRRE